MIVESIDSDSWMEDLPGSFPRKKKKPKSKTKPPSKKGHSDGLINRVWRAFSIYVRVRDASIGSGLCKCISCSNFQHWKECDAGHYIKRRYTALLFNEINVNSECKDCNQFKDGLIVGYRAGLVEKYKEPIVLDLEANKGFKTWDRAELSDLLKLLRVKIPAIRKQKGI